jgi:V-type H+-transporting ATPase subunit E
MQVAGELKKMTAFIRQEALEKAKEIEIKADEEFAIEKSKLVRQETASIDSSYEKKFKQASMSQQITRSTVSNKSRLKVLSARQELLDDLFEEARKKLSSYSKDKKKYQETLKNLILEGMYALSEPKLQVRARKADFAVVKDAITAAEKEFKDKTGKDGKVTLDEGNPQPEGSYVNSAMLPQVISY